MFRVLLVSAFLFLVTSLSFSQDCSSYLTYPVNGSTGVSKSSITFNWNDLTPQAGCGQGLVTYDIQVIKLSTMQTVVMASNLSSSDYTAYNFMGNSQYIWRVRAYCSTTCNYWSDFHTFTTGN